MALAAVDTHTAIAPRQAVALWMADKEAQGRTRQTLADYRCQIGKFLAYLDERGFTDINQVGRDVVRAYLRYCRMAGMPHPSLVSTGRVVVAFLHWAIEEELLPENAADRLRVPKARPAAIEPISTSQARDILKAAARTGSPERDTAMVLLLLDSGMRGVELRRLRDQDVDAENHKIRVLGKGRDGGKWRWVPVSDEALAAIDAYKRVRGPKVDGLFVTRIKKPFSRTSLYNLLRRLEAEVGITGLRSKVHGLRHTFATEWLRAGGDLLSLQQALGHTNLETTAIYARVAFSDVARVHQKVSLGSRLSGGE